MKIVLLVYVVVVILIVLGFSSRVLAEQSCPPTPTNPPTEPPPPNSTPVETEEVLQPPTEVPIEQSTPVATELFPYPEPIDTDEILPYPPPNSIVPDPQPSQAPKQKKEHVLKQELPQTGIGDNLGSIVVLAMLFMTIFIIARYIRNRIS